MPRYRIIDTAGFELGIIEDPRESISEGEDVVLPEGGTAEIVEVYDDDEHGREGGVNAALAVDVDEERGAARGLAVRVRLTA